MPGFLHAWMEPIQPKEEQLNKKYLKQEFYNDFRPCLVKYYNLSLLTRASVIPAGHAAFANLTILCYDILKLLLDS